MNEKPVQTKVVEGFREFFSQTNIKTVTMLAFIITGWIFNL
ncbi:hypothetical protein [Schleiferilactobacillus perolens]|nr:hypothetical protein [Schleiferilactobacillus perolens]